jgi:hypothetical protein
MARNHGCLGSEIDVGLGLAETRDILSYQGKYLVLLCTAKFYGLRSIHECPRAVRDKQSSD